MVAWIDTVSGRRQVARAASAVAVAGALLVAFGILTWPPAILAGIAISLIGIAAMVWAAAHTERADLPAGSAQDICSWEKIADHRRGPIVAIAFRGEYPPGSDGNDFAGAMVEATRAAIGDMKPAALIFDFRELAYSFGDAIGALTGPLIDGDRFRPAAFVAEGRTARSLEPLLASNFPLGVAGVKLFSNRDEALAWVEQALGS